MKKSVWIAAEEPGASILLCEQLKLQSVDVILLCQGGMEQDSSHSIEQIRKVSAVPLIVLSSHGGLTDRVNYLHSGADEVLTKPFSPVELCARITSLLRRVAMDRDSCLDEAKSQQSVKVWGNMKLETGGQQFYCNGAPLPLTQMEFELLRYLWQSYPKAVSRGELLEKIWHFETAIQTRATDDMVKRMRRKLSKAQASLWIETVWGYGFKLMEKD